MTPNISCSPSNVLVSLLVCTLPREPSCILAATNTCPECIPTPARYMLLGLGPSRDGGGGAAGPPPGPAAPGPVALVGWRGARGGPPLLPLPRAPPSPSASLGWPEGWPPAGGQKRGQGKRKDVQAMTPLTGLGRHVRSAEGPNETTTR